MMRGEEFEEVSNTPPVSLTLQLVPALEQKILTLVVEGFERWRAGGFARHGDTEVDFTARLVGCMRDINREKNLPFLLRPEQVEYTDEIYAGKTSPMRAPRIDICVWWGFAEHTYFVIECKRIARGHLAREYVEEGMQRFVSGKYADAHDSAAMIGYLIVTGELPEQVLAHINKRIQKVLSTREALSASAPIGTVETVFISTHARATGKPVRLTHIFLDLRSRSLLSQ